MKLPMKSNSYSCEVAPRSKFKHACIIHPTDSMVAVALNLLKTLGWWIG